jgi:hypothetical protein
MHRFSKLLILVAVLTALILPISTVAAATGYNVAGVEYAATETQGSFAGAAVSQNMTEFGVWQAVVNHTGLTIDGGAFTFKSKIRTFNGAIDKGGTFAPNAGGSCAKQTFDVSGGLNSGTGSFHVTLTHYGYMRGVLCVTYFATVRGTASF